MFAAARLHIRHIHSEFDGLFYNNSNQIENKTVGTGLKQSQNGIERDGKKCQSKKGKKVFVQTNSIDGEMVLNALFVYLTLLGFSILSMWAYCV